MSAFFPLYFYSYIYFFMLTNPLTTHKLKPLAYPVLFVPLIFPFILFIVPKLCFSKYRRDVKRYGSYRF